MSKLSIAQSKLEHTIQRDWENRFYRYDDSKYENDCMDYLKQFCKAEKLRVPFIIFLDSPAGCVFAAEVIKKLKAEGLKTYKKNSVSESSIIKIWENAFSTNDALNTDTIELSERDSIINSTLDSIEGINLTTNDNYIEESYGNAFQYFLHSRNIENIKLNISVHLWDTYYPMGSLINVDFMISSLNQFPDEHGTLRQYNYREYLFFDLMSRTSVIQDNLYNDLRHLLLNGVFDIYWVDQICHISKLPKSVKRNKSDSLTSKSTEISFFDGYIYKTK